MPPPETYRSEIGSQSTMCQVYTWCIRLITRAWKNRLYRLPPKKDYHVYITRSIYHYAYARQTQVNWKKETKNKQEEKGKERMGDRDFVVGAAVEIAMEIAVRIGMASAMGLHGVPLLAAAYRGSSWNVRGSPWNARGSPWKVRSSPWRICGCP